jgi:glycosyltransferase involved in cell wall biosynthesis
VYYNSNRSAGLSFFKNAFSQIKPGIIFLNGLYSFSYHLKPLMAAWLYRSQNKPTKIILSPRGMLHPGALSQKRFKKWLYFLLFKLSGVSKKISWHATDEKEVHFIRQKFKHARIDLAGNFPKLSKPQPSPYKEQGKLIMGTIALISAMKNHLEILNALKSIGGAITWHIYGPIKDQSYWQSCTSLINQLPSNIQVIYHGAINPNQVPSALETIQLFILPSKSENFGHAICEAMSAGRPVITTDTTPYSNLQHFNAGYTINNQNFNEDLTKAIQLFADMETDEFNVYTENAIGYIHNKTNLQKIKSQYQNLFSIV